VQQWRETGQRPSAVMVWTPQQAGEFLDYAEDHDIVLYPLFVLILHRGLRRGTGQGRGRRRAGGPADGREPPNTSARLHHGTQLSRQASTRDVSQVLMHRRKAGCGYTRAYGRRHPAYRGAARHYV
jgi:hypothetical protein